MKLQFDSTSSAEESTDIFVPGSSSNKSALIQEDKSVLKKGSYLHNVQRIETNPKLFLGLPKESHFLVKILENNCWINYRDILVTLSKIRLNHSFYLSSTFFGMEASPLLRICKKTLKQIAPRMKNLIKWPTEENIRMRTPISFRSRYGTVCSIIDCFEIQIEKPNDPVKQSLTWSQYKGCNTFKYLISCTPKWLITFVSKGYGGRASDLVIVEDCGYLDYIENDMCVMADRGFKHLTTLLQAKGAKLLKPLSVMANQRSTASEVKFSKQIAALKVHVERVISRLREFDMLLPHATIDNHYIGSLNKIVNIACEIVNLQNYLINF